MNRRRWQWRMSYHPTLVTESAAGLVRTGREVRRRQEVLAMGPLGLGYIVRYTLWIKPPPFWESEVRP